MYKRQVENGVILHYDLATTGVALDVEVLLEDESVLVRVPYERINCYADFSIVSIDMMPYSAPVRTTRTASCSTRTDAAQS